MTGEAKHKSAPRGPEVFDLQEATGDGARKVTIREEADFTEALVPESAPAAPEPCASWLNRAFWGAVSLLVSLFLVDAVWSLVLSLGQKSPLAGQLGLALVTIITLIALFWLGREFRAILRLRAVRQLREQCRAAADKPTEGNVRHAVSAIMAFYDNDAGSAAGRAEIERSNAEIHDPPTRLAIAERALMRPKDDAARRAVAAAAQRVSVVTAVSPRAIVDVLFVLAQSIALIRALSAIYGGRASGFALLALTRRIAGHLAITGGMAAADQVMGQVMGAGLAARLSAKLGEGILNGVLTARVGLAAIEATRPMDFRAEEPIILSEVVKSVVTQE
ncbi:MAG: TIGR01620 family protein [Rhizobiales bacterium]|nr:TIGR01620 family protein [Hyphomicrobiales bacterium]